MVSVHRAQDAPIVQQNHEQNSFQTRHIHDEWAKLTSADFKWRNCVILPRNLNQLICHIDQSPSHMLLLLLKFTTVFSQTLKYFDQSDTQKKKLQSESNLWMIICLLFAYRGRTWSFVDNFCTYFRRFRFSCFVSIIPKFQLNATDGETKPVFFIHY